MKQALARHDPIRYDIAHARTTHVIRHSGLHAAGLVEYEVLSFFIDVDACAIDADHVRVGVNSGALGNDDLAVNLNAALIDKDLCMAAGGNARLGQHLLEAFALVLGILLSFTVYQPVRAQVAGDGIGGGLLLYVLMAGRLSVRDNHVAVSLFLVRCAIAASGWSHGCVLSIVLQFAAHGIAPLSGRNPTARWAFMSSPHRSARCLAVAARGREDARGSQFPGAPGKAQWFHTGVRCQLWTRGLRSLG